jgi:DNA-binding beta-propeller fold protein YncE
LPGAAGHFDFMSVDRAGRRVLAAHTGAGTLEILDIESGKTLKPISVGDPQGIAVDEIGRRYFLGNEKKHSVVVVDAQTLAKTADVPVGGPVDAIAYDSKNGLIYAAQDDGTRLWVIDPKLARVSGKVEIPGVPEVLEYDAKTDRIYLNIKDKNLVVRINPSTNKVDAQWPTLPATTPRGLIIDSEHGQLVTAGANGKLAMLDLQTGKILSSVDIPTGVDQIAFDSQTRTIYGACNGFVSVTDVDDKGLKAQQSLVSAKGAHTLAVDPRTHQVWVSYSDSEHSYLENISQKK